MKKIGFVIFIFLIVFTISACGKKEQEQTTEPEPTEKAQPGLIVP